MPVLTKCSVAGAEGIVGNCRRHCHTRGTAVYGNFFGIRRRRTMKARERRSLCNPLDKWCPRVPQDESVAQKERRPPSEQSILASRSSLPSICVRWDVCLRACTGSMLACLARVASLQDRKPGMLVVLFVETQRSRYERSSLGRPSAVALVRHAL